MVLQGMLQQHMSLHLMLYEATGMNYNPLDNRMLLFVLAATASIWGFQEQVDTYKCIVGLNIIVIACSLHFITHLILEMTSVLNIHCFKV